MTATHQIKIKELHLQPPNFSDYINPIFADKNQFNFKNFFYCNKNKKSKLPTREKKTKQITKTFYSCSFYDNPQSNKNVESLDGSYKVKFTWL